MKNTSSLSPYYQLLLYFILYALFFSCTESEKAPPLNGVKNIVVSDNGNTDFASDIEVNFEKQLVTNNILEYRVYLTKAEASASFTINEAESMPLDRYNSSLPAEIFPIKGLKLSKNTSDTDGDPISNQSSYIVSVLSVSKDEEIASNILSKDTEPFQLKINNLLSQHGQQLEVGLGSLSIDSDDNVYMSTYSVLSDLTDDRSTEFPVVRISKSGTPTDYSSPYSILGGSAIDDKGNLYQSILKTGTIMKIDKNGTETIVEHNGFELQLIADIFIDPSNNLFVIDVSTNSVVKITPDGTSTFIARISAKAKSITGDEMGNLYVSHNSEEGTITKINSTQEVSVLTQIPVKRPENYNLEFLQWTGDIEYKDSHLYVASTSTSRIYKVS